MKKIEPNPNYSYNLIFMTEQNIIQLIEEIELLRYTVRLLAWAIIALVIGLYIGIFCANRMITKVTGIESISFNEDKAQEMYARGQINELLKYCQKHIKSHKNDIYIHWYFALAYYSNGNYSEAKHYFNRVIEINPHWKESALGYLNNIDDITQNANNENLQ